jgi:hypothetical protein
VGVEAIEEILENFHELRTSKAAEGFDVIDVDVFHWGGGLGEKVG